MMSFSAGANERALVPAPYRDAQEALYSAAWLMSLAVDPGSASPSLNSSTAFFLPILRRSASLMLALLNQSEA